MSKIFIDEETGEKWELDEEFTDFLKSRDSSGSVVITPIATEKQNYALTMFVNATDEYVLTEGIDCTEPQARAVAASIEALLEYMQMPIEELKDGKPYPSKDYPEHNYIYYADEARKALREGE